MDEVERHARLDAWFRAMRDRVLAYLLHRTDPETAQDVLQEVFVTAFRRARRRARSARRLAAGHGPPPARERSPRRATRRDRLTTRVANDEPVVRAGRTCGRRPRPRPSGTPSTGCPTADREVLTLSAWYGLGAEEAAQALGCSQADLPGAPASRPPSLRRSDPAHRGGRAGAPLRRHSMTDDLAPDSTPDEQMTPAGTPGDSRAPGTAGHEDDRRSPLDEQLAALRPRTAADDGWASSAAGMQALEGVRAVATAHLLRGEGAHRAAAADAPARSSPDRRPRHERPPRSRRSWPSACPTAQPTTPERTAAGARPARVSAARAGEHGAGRLHRLRRDAGGTAQPHRGARARLGATRRLPVAGRVRLRRGARARLRTPRAPAPVRAPWWARQPRPRTTRAPTTRMPASTSRTSSRPTAPGWCPFRNGVLRVVDAATRKITGSLDLTQYAGAGQAQLLLAGDRVLVILPGDAYPNYVGLPARVPWTPYPTAAAEQHLPARRSRRRTDGPRLAPRQGRLRRRPHGRRHGPPGRAEPAGPHLPAPREADAGRAEGHQPRASCGMPRSAHGCPATT